jgi:hypothetical protein
MDMWEDTSEGYCSSNESIEFFVSADGELEVARGNTLDFEILGSVLLINTAPDQDLSYPCKLENFRSEIFEDSGNIDSCDTHPLLSVVL